MLIKNARIVNPWGETFGDVLIDRGRIRKIGKPLYGYMEGESIDLEGDFLFPGFIDVHIQGAGGADILDEDEEAVSTISETCVKFGVTGFLATTVYKPGFENKHLEAALNGFSKGLNGARFLGFHLEGPFISREKRGMIQESSVCEPSVKVLSEIMDKCKGWLKMMTLAPELEGSEQVISLLLENRVIVSFGHSSADYEQTLKAIRIGVKHVTHFFNTMPPIHHRAPGPAIAIFESKDVTVQIISDGVHIHPSMVRFATRILGEDRIVLITDGVRSTGLPDGKYVYNGIEFISSNGTARYVDGTLIGTSAGMSELARRFAKFTGVPLSSVAKVASYNPARLLGVEECKGSIEEGKDADMVVIGEDFRVRMTLIGGILFEA
ncbi:MAG: N-acetylglucosamine-6-phosphate deacetylase [Candidatus Brockarchaeota archaeon]|nr:N-acetylglucosamine-6-phosphate deacetylase [Candidatus Brockarchaeota archaeon]